MRIRFDEGGRITMIDFTDTILDGTILITTYPNDFEVGVYQEKYYWDGEKISERNQESDNTE